MRRAYARLLAAVERGKRRSATGQTPMSVLFARAYEQNVEWAQKTLGDFMGEPPLYLEVRGE